MRSFIVLCLTTVVATTGCRGPTRQAVAPPSLDAHGRSWVLRRPDTQAVVEYAAQLGERANPDTRTPFDVADGVTLSEAEAVALVLNPELRIARMEARVPLAGAFQAGHLPDPRLEFDVLRILSSIASPWVLGSALEFTIPLSARLPNERAHAFAEADAATQAAHVAEEAVRRRVRDAWNRWSATGERMALVRTYLEDLGEVIRVGQSLREADQIGTPQLRVLEIEQIKREGDLHTLEIEQDVQRTALLGLMGLVPEAEIELVPELTGEIADPGTAADREHLRRGNLELALARARYEAAERGLTVELCRRTPDLNIGPAGGTEEGDPRVGGAGGITLPLWNRNRRAIAEARATRDAARTAYEARYEILVTELSEARGSQRLTRTRSEWLTTRVGPLADKQLAELQNISALGDMDVLILKDALTSVLETKLQVLDVRMERALIANHIRSLVEPLEGPSLR